MPRYLVIALLVTAAGCTQAGEKVLDRTFTVSPGGSLMVDADGAAGHVSGTDANQVVVHMVMRGSDQDLASATLDAVQKANDVSVTMKRSKRSWLSWSSGSDRQDIEVKVPRQYAIDVSTSGGSVEL